MRLRALSPPPPLHNSPRPGVVPSSPAGPVDVDVDPPPRSRALEDEDVERLGESIAELVIRGRLSPEVGAVVRCALEAAANRLHQEAKAAEDGAEMSADQRRADALGLVAESALAADLDRGASTSGDRYQVVVHVDEGVLVDGEDEKDGAPGQSALEGMEGLRVSAETSRRLACDAATVVMHHGRAGPVLDVGRKRRTISPALRRALTTRDPECRFPGCQARHCDDHHVRHWAAGGATRLDNLVRLCRRHHRAVHEEGFTVTLQPDGTARFRRPDGRPLPVAPPAPRLDGPPLAPMLAHLKTAGITIDPQAGRPRWYGEQLDEVWAIDVLWKPRTAGSSAGAHERGAAPGGA